jgi:aromatic ring-opening dioxygenase catalytic subunit (LigB family)
MQLQPVIFVSHGGGPWPWMPEAAPLYKNLSTSLIGFWSGLRSAPDAIVVISAHWEANQFLVSSGSHPAMIYDYGGFPPHTYQVKYQAPGQPELASRIVTMLKKNSLQADVDPQRGYDHGTFVPLYVMHPEAKTPVVQISLNRRLDPSTHMAMGEALRPLRKENILIVASGLSFHNLGQFGRSGAAASKNFDGWLTQTLTNPHLNRDAKQHQLYQWSQAPDARTCHPREEHLVPLFVAFGASYDGLGRTQYHETDFMGGLTVSNFVFQG